MLSIITSQKVIVKSIRKGVFYILFHYNYVGLELKKSFTVTHFCFSLNSHAQKSMG